MKHKIFFTSITSIIFFTHYALAQDPRYSDRYIYKENKNASTEQNYDVLKRKRPEYDAVGKNIGSFNLFPSIDLSSGYNDNIRATSNNELDAFFYQVNPALRAESQFSRHALNLFAGSDLTFYQSESDENLQSLYVGSDGRIDIRNDLNIVGGIGFRDANESRFSSNSLAGGFTAEPIQYQTLDLNLGINKRFNRLDMFLGGFRRDIDYDDGVNSVGTNIDQDNRDIEIYGLTGRTTYEISPDYKFFAKGEWTDRTYAIQSANDRDSKGGRIGTGFEFALTNQITGQIFGGFMGREYQNGDDVSDAYAGGKLDWYPTPLVSVYASADRDIQDSIFAGTTSKTVTDLALSAAYEFRRHILIKQNIGYSFGDYEGINGQEKTFTAGSEIEYLFNRNLSFIGTYRHANRDADANLPTGLNYEQNIFALTAKAKI